MVEQSVVKRRISKFRIGDLALASALELERARTRGIFKSAPLEELAQALTQTSLKSEPGAIAAMRPGYFEPFDRLFRSRETNGPDSLDQIDKLVAWAIEGLGDIARTEGKGEKASDLLKFCLQLHQEFVGRPASEARFGRTQRTFPTASSLC